MAKSKAKQQRQSHGGLAKTVAKGAASVAAVAGVVAAGAALADEETRHEITKSVKKGAKVIGENASDMPKSRKGLVDKLGLSSK